MTPHNHRRFVPGCFRCELGRDEARDAAMDSFENFLQAVRETNPGAQVCLVVLDGEITPPLDVTGFIAGLRLDGTWEERGLDAALDFGARALRCETEPEVAPPERTQGS
jgi:hypothetical protein